MGKRERQRARILGRKDVPQAVSVLAESFHDYPVMRFVLGSKEDYPARLRGLVTFFVMARVLRDEAVLGIGGRELDAVALLSSSYGGPSPHELDELRAETWEALGVGARSRYEAFGASIPDFGVDADHLHLNMIGVRARAQGGGLARALLEAVHGRSAADPRSVGVTLTTEVEENVPLYEHFGYEVRGTTEVAKAFNTWAMFRPDA